jgi:hypothetical protein
MEDQKKNIFIFQNKNIIINIEEDEICEPASLVYGIEIFLKNAVE